MTPPLTVLLAGTGTLIERHRTVLASLPDRFRINDRANADVVVDTTLAAPTGRAVLLAQPIATHPGDVRAIGAAARAAGVETAVAYAHVADPTWSSVAELVASDVPGAVVVDSVVTVHDADALLRGLLEQLAVMRSLLPTLDGLTARAWSPQHYLVGGVVDGVPITLSGVVSASADTSMALDVVRVERRWRATWCTEPLARPTVVTRLDADGTHTEPQRFESGLRAAWVALHDRLHGAPNASRTFEHLADDLAMLERWGMLSPVRAE
jgi:hypothetical protein